MRLAFSYSLRNISTVFPGNTLADSLPTHQARSPLDRALCDFLHIQKVEEYSFASLLSSGVWSPSHCSFRDIKLKSCRLFKVTLLLTHKTAIQIWTSYLSINKKYIYGQNKTGFLIYLFLLTLICIDWLCIV